MKKKRGPLVRSCDDADTLLCIFSLSTNKQTDKRNENNDNSINPSSFFKLLSLSLSLSSFYTSKAKSNNDKTNNKTNIDIDTKSSF